MMNQNHNVSLFGRSVFFSVYTMFYLIGSLEFLSLRVHLNTYYNFTTYTILNIEATIPFIVLVSLWILSTIITFSWLLAFLGGKVDFIN